MIAAYHGRELSEEDLVKAARFEWFGISVDEVIRLAEQHGFRVQLRQLNLAEVAKLIGKGTFPIAFIDLGPIDGRSALHAVIPVAVSKRFVTVLDPDVGERRISRAIFEEARQWWGDDALVIES